MKRCSKRLESKKFVLLILRKKLFKITILANALLKSLNMTVLAVLTMGKCLMFFLEKLKNMALQKNFLVSESKLITEFHIWEILAILPCTFSSVKMKKVILSKAIS